MPEYKSMLITSQCLRWGSLGLAGLYLLARVIGGYARMYSDNYSDVASVATTEGFIYYVFETVFIVASLGVMYTLGEALAALRDIARNSYLAVRGDRPTPAPHPGTPR